MNEPSSAAPAPAVALAETLTAKSTGSNESPGYKTTEFWAHACLVAGLVFTSAAGALPAKYAAICITVSGVAYAVSRGLSKQGNSN